MLPRVRRYVFPAALLLVLGASNPLLLRIRAPRAAWESPAEADSPGAPYDWLQMNGDPQHRGNNTRETLLGPSNVAQLAFLFQATLPSVADGAPVLLTGVSTVNGTQDLLFLTRADADGQITESNEGNNTKAASIHIGPPDLVVSSVNAPSTGGAGLTIKVTDTTHNKSGVGPAVASTTRYYLSTNATLDAGDPALGSRPVPALPPGTSSKGSVNVTIPSGTSPGLHYVIAKADEDNAIPETNENNNTSADRIVLGPDLIVSSLSAPSPILAGSQFTVTETTKNQGGGSTAVSSTTSFYLSINSTLGAGDIFLGSRPVGILGPGVSDSHSTTLTIPAQTAAGGYYIIAKADDGGAVAESVEDNNTRAKSVNVTN